MKIPVLVKLMLGVLVLLATHHMVFAQIHQAIDGAIAQIEVNSRVHAIRWNPDGLTLAVATSNGAQFYDSDLTLIEHIHEEDVIYGVSWHPDEDMVAISGNNMIEHPLAQHVMYDRLDEPIPFVIFNPISEEIVKWIPLP